MFPDGSAASAIVVIWQHCVVDFVCIVLLLQLICFGSTVFWLHETASAIDMLWRSRPSLLLFFEDQLASFLPGCWVLIFIFVGFLIVLLLPLMGLKSVVVVLFICFLAVLSPYCSLVLCVCLLSVYRGLFCLSLVIAPTAAVVTVLVYCLWFAFSCWMRFLSFW